MAKTDLPTPKLLRQLLKYDPATGLMYWKPRPLSMFSGGKQSAKHNATAWNNRWQGKPAFTADKGNGYRQGCVFEHRLYAHRVIFAMVEDRWPSEIDHINHDRSNNRWANLREVTRGENARNLSMSSMNKSGVTGVCRDYRKHVWLAYIDVDGQRTNLGSFVSKKSAVEARKAAQAEAGFHPNHGK